MRHMVIQPKPPLNHPSWTQRFMLQQVIQIPVIVVTDFCFCSHKYFLSWKATPTSYAVGTTGSTTISSATSSVPNQTYGDATEATTQSPIMDTTIYVTTSDTDSSNNCH